MLKKNSHYFDFNYKIAYRVIENVNNLEDIQHSTARECLRFAGPKLDSKESLSIFHSGDIPARSGMATSSSYCVGLLNALYALQGTYISKGQLAKDAIYIERHVLQEVGGVQDQLQVSWGGLNKIEFLENGLYHVSPIPISEDRLGSFQSHLLLLYLNTNRGGTASDISNTFVPDIDKKRRQLRISHALVDEGINILCSNKDIRLFGELLHEYWIEKRSLSSAVSNSIIDETYQKALDMGAGGGKLLGAGGGGFLLLFVEPDKQAKITEELGFLHVPFGFEKVGSTIIFKG
jgi:D-glycero-alpha-D-manno-heptose-7-phosphate kinase